MQRFPALIVATLLVLAGSVVAAAVAVETVREAWSEPPVDVASVPASDEDPGTAVGEPPLTAPPAAAEPPHATSPDEVAEEAGEQIPEPSAFHGGPVGGDTVVGLLQFRGNPTRTFYGLGPLPDEPGVAWRYPDRAMCSVEVTTRGSGDDAEREERRWCGTGWTGQPLVWERDDGVTEVIVGAYDGAVHFVDAATGTPTRPPFRTGFMVKGTETLDPDGYPLLYVGSRDGYFRVVALDREVPTELWRLGRHPQGVWNNDWDANPSLVDDVLHVGGEDSWYRAIRLNRGHDDAGLVTIDPEILVEVPAWNDELIANIGDWNVSIESSPAVTDDRVYWVNSGGRVMGLDRAAVERGDVDIVLDYWVGDDADASIVVDRDGFLYVTVEYQRRLARAREVGQLVKLDPTRPDDPRVWGVDIPPRSDIPGSDGGAWATPALYGDLLYLPTHPGDLLVVDRHTGEVVHEERIGYHEWSSPAVVEDADGHPWLLVGMCNTPGLRAYDLADPAAPVEAWTLGLPGCVESTPAVWKGSIYVGSRDGFLYAVR